MGVSLVNSYNHFRRLSILSFFILLFIASTSAITPTLFLGGGERKERSGSSSLEELERVLAQKRRVVPGSSPPTCWSKCGKCSPYLPVHVAIQPGLSIPMDYYPEAWRCSLQLEQRRRK